MKAEAERIEKELEVKNRIVEKKDKNKGGVNSMEVKKKWRTERKRKRSEQDETNEHNHFNVDVKMINK